ncbi:methyltransferase domain-containing protein [Vagococcus sp.]|uniref:methyltransferase domain-containing protein n=1 Tax=Vagococcus sp. TaxID=1933889 RepID=UPI003F96A4A0
MLKKKIEYGQEFLEDYATYFSCPKCHQSMCFKEPSSLVCVAGHRFDLSKKGTLHFPNRHMTSDYDQEMLVARRQMIRAGLYQPIIEYLETILPIEAQESIVEFGCGEGSFLKEWLTQVNFKGMASGFDLSKDGVQLASDYNQQAFWFVGDVTQVPFKAHSLDFILNMLSPVAYDEIKRVLKPKGTFVKIIPESGYLQELRTLFYQEHPEKLNYSNEKTYQKFTEQLKKVNEHRLTYTFPIVETNVEAVLKMSPLHWGASEAARLTARKTKLTSITVDVTVLFGRI